MNQCGIAWIDDYKDHPSLEHTDEAARGFAHALGAQKSFEFNNGNVVSTLFEGGKSSGVEQAEILYFSGHGTDRGPLFNAGNPIVDVAALDLGAAGRLSYAVFDCCRMLDPVAIGRWHPAFEGLVCLLGFGDFAWPSVSRGRVFAELLLRQVPVPEAWRMAAIDTEGLQAPWAVLRAVPNDGRAGEELWSSNKSLRRQAGPPRFFLHQHEKTEITANTEISSPGGSVLMLKTKQSLEWTADRTRSLAQSLGLDQAMEVAHGATSTEVRSGSARLELYRASNSFWLRRKPPQGDVPLFRESAPPPPPGEAIEKSRAFLAAMGLANRLTFHSVSATVERRQELSELSGLLRRADEVIIARHVTYSFDVNGLPVFGPGAKVRVSFEGDEVSEVVFFWRRAVPVPTQPTAPVIPMEEAREILRRSRAFGHLPADSLTIEGGRFGYFAMPPRDQQEYLVPVYEFTGTFQRGDFTYRFTRFVQALRKEHQPWSSDERLREVLP